MVRRRSCAVSNHGHTLILRDAAKTPLLRMRARLAAGELREFLDHALVDRALERNDQVGKILHRLPAPADELGLVTAAGALDVDLGVLAGEPHRVPFLPLAAVA